MFVLAVVLGCGQPDATAGDTEPPVAQEERVDLSDLTPATLKMGEAVALPDTGLTITLVDYRYHRKRSGKLSAWAELTVQRGDEQVETGRWPFSETREVLGRRLHLRGSRSEVLLYVFPD